MSCFHFARMIARAPLVGLGLMLAVEASCLSADVKDAATWIDVLSKAPGLKIVAETSLELGAPAALYSRTTVTSYYQGDKLFHEVKEERADAKDKPLRHSVVSFDGERTYVIHVNQFAYLTEGRAEAGLGTRYLENPLALVAIAVGAFPPDERQPCAPSLTQVKKLLTPERVLALGLGNPAEVVGKVGPVLQYTVEPNPSSGRYVQQLSIHKESGSLVGAILRRVAYPDETEIWAVSKMTTVTFNGQSIPFPAQYTMTASEHFDGGTAPVKLTWTLKEAQILTSTPADKFAPDPRQYGVSTVYDTETKQSFELK